MTNYSQFFKVIILNQKLFQLTSFVGNSLLMNSKIYESPFYTKNIHKNRCGLFVKNLIIFFNFLEIANIFNKEEEKKNE